MKEYLPKILIVDDSPENLKILGNSLKKLKYNVLTALSGKQALALVENKHPDLIILDVMMPLMDGFEVCRRLKDNKHHRNIPVIFLTALSEPENVNKGLEIGAADYVTKPYHTDDLIIKIKHQLRTKQKNDYLAKTVKINQLILKFIQTEIELRIRNEEVRRNIDKSLLNEEDPRNSHSIYHLLKFASNYNFAVFEQNNLNFQLPEVFDDIKILGNTDNHNIKKNALSEVKTTNTYHGNFFQLVKLIEKYINLDLPYKNLEYSQLKVELNEISEQHDLISIKLVSTGDLNIAGKLSAHTKLPLFEQKFKEHDVEMTTIFIIEMLIHLMDGNFSYENISGKNIFTLEFLLHRSSPAIAESNVFTTTEISLAGTNVLVVEDNELNQAYVSSLLSDFSVEFEIVTNGTEAIDRALTGNFDVILMDVNLPQISGLEVVSTLRKKHNFLKPIVAISGHSDEAFIKECLNNGFDHYLVKPHDAEELRRIILMVAASGTKAPSKPRLAVGSNINMGGQRYNYDKAKELANGNTDMLKYWLNNLCELLNKALPVLDSIKEKQLYTKGNKVFHDLVNYSSYFELSSICLLINELNRLDNKDPDYVYELEYTLQLLDAEIKSVIVYYSNVNETIGA